MRRKTAVILGVSGAALALTASSAFTAGGLTAVTGLGFLGGSKAITVTGTEIATMSYTDDSGDSSKVSDIVFTFTDQNAVGKTPTITLAYTSGNAPTGWTCAAITAVSNSSTSTSTCSKPTSNGVSATKASLSTVTLTVA